MPSILQTLVLLETAFDETWLMFKTFGNRTVKPDELARRLAMEGERVLFDYIMKRRGATAPFVRLAQGELSTDELNIHVAGREA